MPQNVFVSDNLRQLTLLEGYIRPFSHYTRYQTKHVCNMRFSRKR